MNLGKLYLVFAVLALITPVTAEISFQQAEEYLNQSEAIISEMNSTGLPIQRVSDLQQQAQNHYQAQLVLNRSGKDTDLSRVKKLTDKIASIRKKALRVNDRIKVLENKINELEKKEALNLSSAKAQLEKARQEFQNERFEKSEKHVEKAYREISNTRSAVTQASAFYSATSSGLKSYLKRNTKEIGASSIVMLFLLVIGIREYGIYKLKRRKKKLETRRNVLEDLLEQAQQDYFKEGEISKTSFQTRKEVYQGKIREINRELPVVKQELDQRDSLKAIFH